MPSNMTTGMRKNMPSEDRSAPAYQQNSMRDFSMRRRAIHGPFGLSGRQKNAFNQ